MEGYVVRPTGILIEDDKILLVKQDVTETRHWSLPGGALEFGETLEQCLVREIKEETGLEVIVNELLYVCDRFYNESHVVHMTFLVERIGGRIRNGQELKMEEERIKEIEMVPLSKLQDYGFSSRFCSLVESNFPDRGTYQGDFKEFYGER